MNNISHINQIAEESAATVIRKFLQEFPNELSSSLPPDFLDCLSTELKTDIRSYIHSRLQWSVQSAKAEILEKKRQEDQSNQKPQQGWNLLPPERLQSIPTNEQSKSHQRVQTVLQTRSIKQADKSDDINVVNHTTDELEFLQKLKRSPNRQRRRRRRSSTSESQESILNAT